MATLYRCDRCKADRTERHEITHINVPRMTKQYGLPIDQDDNYSVDLCSNCWAMVIELIKSPTMVVVHKGMITGNQNG